MNGANPNARTEDFVRPLHMSLQEQHWEVAKILIEAGADPTAETGEGYTPLHFAAQHCNTEWSKFFIECGNDINAMSNDGNTPLKIATERGNDKYVQFLQSFGARKIDVFSLVEDQIAKENAKDEFFSNEVQAHGHQIGASPSH